MTTLTLGKSQREAFGEAITDAGARNSRVVVLDIMIHDIDIILSLAASKPVKVDAVGVGVIDDNEDICSARIEFANGCIANVTASRLALKTERKVRVFSRQAYLSVDYLKKTGTVIKAEPNVDVIEKIRELKKKANSTFSRRTGRSCCISKSWMWTIPSRFDSNRRRS